MDLNEYSLSPALTAAAPTRLAFLRKVYALFFVSLLLGGAGAVAGLEPHVLQVTLRHPLACWLGEMALIYACSALRARRGINLALLFAFTFASGLIATPYLLLMAMRGGSEQVVSQAFALTCVVFGGLSAYTLVSRRDFSWLRGFAVTSLFALIGVGLLDALWFHSDAVSMALSAAGVMIFSCWVLYDTSMLMRRAASDDAVGAALSLYLDFINLFFSILRLLSGRRR